MIKNQIVILSLLTALIGCGGHSTHKADDAPVAPGPKPAPSAPAPGGHLETPTATSKNYKAVKAVFEGSFVGISDGKVFNFDARREPTVEMKVVVQNVDKPEDTKNEVLPQRPQRIDRISDEFLLLQRPGILQNGIKVARDAYLISTRSGIMWKFDDFIPDFKSLQYVEKGSSKRLYFIGYGEKDNDYSTGMTPEQRKDYNVNASTDILWEGIFGRSKQIVRIDLSNLDKVALVPLTTEKLEISSFQVNNEGVVLFKARDRDASVVDEKLTIYMDKANQLAEWSNVDFEYGNSILQKDPNGNFWLHNIYETQKVSFTLVNGRPEPVLAPKLDYKDDPSNPYNLDLYARPAFASYLWSGKTIFAYDNGILLIDQDKQATVVKPSLFMYGSKIFSTIIRDDINQILFYASSGNQSSLFIYDLSTLSVKTVTVGSGDATNNNVKIKGTFTSMVTLPDSSVEIRTQEAAGTNTFTYKYSKSKGFEEVSSNTTAYAGVEQILVPVSIVN